MLNLYVIIEDLKSKEARPIVTLRQGIYHLLLSPGNDNFFYLLYFVLRTEYLIVKYIEMLATQIIKVPVHCQTVH